MGSAQKRIWNWHHDSPFSIRSRNFFLPHKREWVLNENISQIWANSQAQVCDSLHGNLSITTKKYLKALSKSLFDVDKTILVKMFPSQKQQDSFSCKLFDFGFLAENFGGISPTESQFETDLLRKRFKKCFLKC